MRPNSFEGLLKVSDDLGFRGGVLFMMSVKLVSGRGMPGAYEDSAPDVKGRRLWFQGFKNIVRMYS